MDFGTGVKRVGMRVAGCGPLQARKPGRAPPVCALDVELRALLLAECDSEPQAPALGCGFDEWLAFYFDPELTADKVNKGTGCDKANVLRGLREFNHAYFKSEAVETAAKRLPGYLYDLCTLPDCSMVPGPT